MSVDAANTLKLLTTTRAVRRRLDFDRPVERSLIEKCVEAALQAPSAGDVWQVHFSVVTDPERREHMRDIYCQAHFPYLDERQPREMAKLSAEEAAQFARHWDMIRWFTENVHRAPVHVHVSGPDCPRDADPFTQASFYSCILPPAWSFMLALRAHGVGTNWITIHLRDPHQGRVREMLGLPDDHTLGVFLPCAYYTGEDFKTAQRPGIAEVLHWDQW